MTCLQVACSLPPAQAVPATADISAIASTAVAVASAVLGTSASNLISINAQKETKQECLELQFKCFAQLGFRTAVEASNLTTLEVTL